MEIALMILRRYWSQVAALLLGFSIAYYAQGLRIEDRDLKLDKARVEVTACQDANMASQGTIAELNKEVATTEALCEERYKVKNKVAKNIKNNKSLKPSKVTTDENNKTVVVVDAIWLKLNSMFPPSN